MGGLPKFLDRFEAERHRMPPALGLGVDRETAWTTIRYGQTAFWQLLSPAFNLTDAPVRVAVPFPSLYEMGKGQLMVLGTEATATISLVPPWLVSFGQGNMAAR